MKKNIFASLFVIVLMSACPRDAFAGTDFINNLLTKAGNIIDKVAEKYEVVSVRIREITGGKLFSVSETTMDTLQKIKDQTASIQERIDKIRQAQGFSDFLNEEDQKRYKEITDILNNADEKARDILKERGWKFGDDYGKTDEDSEDKNQDIGDKAMGYLSSTQDSLINGASNIAGNIAGSVNDAVSSVESSVMGGVTNVAGEASDALNNVSNAINNVTSFLYLSDNAKIKGQPESLWQTPWGDDDGIMNSDNNRCRIIKTLKPGETSVMQTKYNTEGLLTRYASELYYEAVKTSFAIDREKPDSPKNSTAEVTVINRDVIARLANIANRFNIIVSLEARTASLDNVHKLSKLGASVFNDYEYDVENGVCQRSNGRE